MGMLGVMRWSAYRCSALLCMRAVAHGDWFTRSSRIICPLPLAVEFWSAFLSNASPSGYRSGGSSDIFLLPWQHRRFSEQLL